MVFASWRGAGSSLDKKDKRSNLVAALYVRQAARSRMTASKVAPKVGAADAIRDGAGGSRVEIA
ncbi:MAG: hypothetical protein NVSMB5_16210 [Candidatus Velthaea sp.]